ncbi:hypothetical protein BJ742DRAFT_851085 [Cladochytrium replicatum]|nr:hypothetical protein BJ742DRAFT_851085 [Cladochytrium replicatum]
MAASKNRSRSRNRSSTRPSRSNSRSHKRSSSSDSYSSYSSSYSDSSDYSDDRSSYTRTSRSRSRYSISSAGSRSGDDGVSRRRNTGPMKRSEDDMPKKSSPAAESHVVDKKPPAVHADASTPTSMNDGSHRINLESGFVAPAPNFNLPPPPAMPPQNGVISLPFQTNEPYIGFAGPTGHIDNEHQFNPAGAKLVNPPLQQQNMAFGPPQIPYAQQTHNAGYVPAGYPNYPPYFAQPTGMQPIQPNMQIHQGPHLYPMNATSGPMTRGLASNLPPPPLSVPEVFSVQTQLVPITVPPFTDLSEDPAVKTLLSPGDVSVSQPSELTMVNDSVPPSLDGVQSETVNSPRPLRTVRSNLILNEGGSDAIQSPPDITVDVVDDRSSYRMSGQDEGPKSAVSDDFDYDYMAYLGQDTDASPANGEGGEGGPGGLSIDTKPATLSRGDYPANTLPVADETAPSLLKYTWARKGSKASTSEDAPAHFGVNDSQNGDRERPRDRNRERSRDRRDEQSLARRGKERDRRDDRDSPRDRSRERYRARDSSRDRDGGRANSRQSTGRRTDDERSKRRTTRRERDDNDERKRKDRRAERRRVGENGEGEVEDVQERERRAEERRVKARSRREDDRRERREDERRDNKRTEDEGRDGARDRGTAEERDRRREREREERRRPNSRERGNESRRDDSGRPRSRSPSDLRRKSRDEYRGERDRRRSTRDPDRRRSRVKEEKESDPNRRRTRRATGRFDDEDRRQRRERDRSRDGGRADKDRHRRSSKDQEAPNGGKATDSIKNVEVLEHLKDLSRSLQEFVEKNGNPDTVQQAVPTNDTSDGQTEGEELVVNEVFDFRLDALLDELTDCIDEWGNLSEDEMSIRSMSLTRKAAQFGSIIHGPPGPFRQSGMNRPLLPPVDPPYLPPPGAAPLAENQKGGRPVINPRTVSVYAFRNGGMQRPLGPNAPIGPPNPFFGQLGMLPGPPQLPTGPSLSTPSITVAKVLQTPGVLSAFLLKLTTIVKASGDPIGGGPERKREWKRRFFILARGQLHLFATADPEEQSALSMVFEPETIVQPVENGPLFVLEIRGKGPNAEGVLVHRQWFLQCESRHQMDQWEKAIFQVIRESRDSAPGITSPPMSPVTSGLQGFNFPPPPIPQPLLNGPVGELAQPNAIIHPPINPEQEAPHGRMDHGVFATKLEDGLGRAGRRAIGNGEQPPGGIPPRAVSMAPTRRIPGQNGPAPIPIPIDPAFVGVQQAMFRRPSHTDIQNESGRPPSSLFDPSERFPAPPQQVVVGGPPVNVPLTRKPSEPGINYRGDPTLTKRDSRKFGVAPLRAEDDGNGQQNRAYPNEHGGSLPDRWNAAPSKEGWKGEDARRIGPPDGTNQRNSLFMGSNYGSSEGGRSPATKADNGPWAESSGTQKRTQQPPSSQGSPATSQAEVPITKRTSLFGGWARKGTQQGPPNSAPNGSPTQQEGRIAPPVLPHASRPPAPMWPGTPQTQPQGLPVQGPPPHGGPFYGGPPPPQPYNPYERPQQPQGGYRY